MKKLNKHEKDGIINLFPDIDDIFEHELDPNTIGYESYGISVYDGWLSESEYNKSVIRDRKRITEINKVRTEFIMSFYPSIYLCSHDDEIYEFENKNELFEFIKHDLNEGMEISFLSVHYNAIIEVSCELTEIIHFYKSTRIDDIKLKAQNLELNVFSNI